MSKNIDLVKAGLLKIAGDEECAGRLAELLDNVRSDKEGDLFIKPELAAEIILMLVFAKWGHISTENLDLAAGRMVHTSKQQAWLHVANF